jgi:hypothetical protein
MADGQGRRQGARECPDKVLGEAEVVDPLGGSYYVEALTKQMEEAILDCMSEIDQMGGMLKTRESGFRDDTTFVAHGARVILL